MKSKRARADQYARRVNTAGRLLDSGLEVSQATRRIAQRYGLSDRQARRYVEHARDEGEVEVPKAKIVFTVKLTAGLAQRVRAFARASGRTVSALVAQALHEYLDRERAGPRGGR